MKIGQPEVHACKNSVDLHSDIVDGIPAPTICCCRSDIHGTEIIGACAGAALSTCIVHVGGDCAVERGQRETGSRGADSGVDVAAYVCVRYTCSGWAGRTWKKKMRSVNES